ncbi:MAG: hypothetical protein HETSPECPRED_006638 [Heterodermia speciosa]|uniref:Uncharacterized protein n=1 Tax=Heterodermia speciosa TaxID=116794 RepID=A0A8H3FUK6_9LECA|nr:MAG: hypothetical protein HETSPECPRED_006638 [Heterodermia speciosa]
MHSPSILSAASFCLLVGIFATTVLTQGSIQLVNYCPEEVLYESRVGSANITGAALLNSGEIYTMSFSEAQPQDPTADHKLSFDAWPAYNSDKKTRSLRPALLAPRQSDLSEDQDWGFEFLIWDVAVTEQGVAFGFEDQATDPFPEWGWTWKLASGDKACTPCTALGCAAEGCSLQEDLVMEFCGEGDTPEPLVPTSSLDRPASISAPTSSPTSISSISIPPGSATPLAPSATKTYPQYITTTTSATASIIAGSLFPRPSGSGAVLPSGSGYHYRPSPVPSAFTGAASKLQEGYVGAFALAAGLMMF